MESIKGQEVKSFFFGVWHSDKNLELARDRMRVKKKCSVFQLM